jgi:hypothetical protein
VGLGSALVDPKLVAAGDFAALTARARRVTAQVEAARAERPADPRGVTAPDPAAGGADA